eukprot:3646381-Rhodomonas_salina.1
MSAEARPPDSTLLRSTSPIVETRLLHRIGVGGSVVRGATRAMYGSFCTKARARKRTTRQPVHISPFPPTIPTATTSTTSTTSTLVPRVLVLPLASAGLWQYEGSAWKEFLPFSAFITYVPASTNASFHRCFRADSRIFQRRDKKVGRI